MSDRCPLGYLCFLINFWSLFQVQSYLPLSIVNYGVSKAIVAHWATCLQKVSLEWESNNEYVVFMVYTNLSCGGHLHGVTSTIYAKVLCPHAQEKELKWPMAFEILYVQFLFGNLCFKCIPSCNSPEEYTAS